MSQKKKIITVLVVPILVVVVAAVAISRRPIGASRAETSASMAQTDPAVQQAIDSFMRLLEAEWKQDDETIVLYGDQERASAQTVLQNGPQDYSNLHEEIVSVQETAKVETSALTQDGAIAKILLTETVEYLPPPQTGDTDKRMSSRNDEYSLELSVQNGSPDTTGGNAASNALHVTKATLCTAEFSQYSDPHDASKK